MANYEGLALPAYGAFKKYNEAQTEVWSIEDSGVFNISITSSGADNYVSLTLSDTQTITTGYVQGYYASVTAAGTYTTANTQITGVAVDLTLSGSIGVEAQGMYVYVIGSAPTLTNGNINGIQVYMDDLGAAPTTRALIQLHQADGNTASYDAAIYLRMEGSSSTCGAFIEKNGTASIDPIYFLKTNGTAGAGKWIEAYTAAGTQDKVLRCLINGSTYWIPLYAASA